jgi:hypothetical protein
MVTTVGQAKIIRKNKNKNKNRKKTSTRELKTTYLVHMVLSTVKDVRR